MVEPCQSLASRGGGPDLHSAKFHIDTSHSLLLKSGSSEGTQLRILSGDAEIFGRPVRAGDVVDVPINRSFNIETQKRAEIEVMSAHRDVHSVLTCPYSRGVAPIVDEILRFYTPTHTPAAEIEPLTVLLCGNTDSGKSTLFTYISNWMMAQKERTVTGGSCACKGASIILVDGDLGQGSLSIPGTLAAMEVSDYIDPWAPFPKCAPFATYFFGGLNFGGGQPLRTYTLLCQKLQGKVNAKWRQRWMNEKLCSCPRARRPLILINTMGWIASTGFRCLQALGRVFRVNGIIGLGTTHDFVHTLAMSTVSNVQELNARFHFYTCYEIQTEIARRSSAHRQVHRTLRLNAFFTGTRLLSQGSRVQLRPLHIVAIPWSDVQFFAQREIQQKSGPSPRSHVHQSAAPADEKSSIDSLLDSSLLPFESYLGIKLSFGEVASLATCVCAFVRIPAQLEYRNKCGTENHGAGEACDVPCDALAALLFGFLVGCDRGFVHMALATQLEPNALPSNTIIVSRTIKVSPEMYTLSKTFLKKAP